MRIIKSPNALNSNDQTPTDLRCRFIDYNLPRWRAARGVWRKGGELKAKESIISVSISRNCGKLTLFRYLFGEVVGLRRSLPRQRLSRRSVSHSVARVAAHLRNYPQPLYLCVYYAILIVCLWGASPIRLIHKLKAGTTKISARGGCFCF